MRNAYDKIIDGFDREIHQLEEERLTIGLKHISKTKTSIQTLPITQEAKKELIGSLEICETLIKDFFEKLKNAEEELNEAEKRRFAKIPYSRQQEIIKSMIDEKTMRYLDIDELQEFTPNSVI